MNSKTKKKLFAALGISSLILSIGWLSQTLFATRKPFGLACFCFSNYCQHLFLAQMNSRGGKWTGQIK